MPRIYSLSGSDLHTGDVVSYSMRTSWVPLISLVAYKPDKPCEKTAKCFVLYGLASSRLHPIPPLSPRKSFPKPGSFANLQKQKEHT